MSSEHVLSCARWERGRPATDPQQDRSTWGLARWAKEHEYFGIPPKYYPVRWVNLRAGNIDRRKPQICYICKTSYPSEEAMRNHAKRDHKGHKQVEQRSKKQKIRNRYRNDLPYMQEKLHEPKDDETAYENGTWGNPWVTKMRWVR